MNQKHQLQKAFQRNTFLVTDLPITILCLLLFSYSNTEIQEETNKSLNDKL